MKFPEQNTADLGNWLKVIIHQGFWNVMLYWESCWSPCSWRRKHCNPLKCWELLQ